MQGDIKASRCIPNNDLRKLYRGTYITDFLKASINTDSIKEFSITFRSLITVYCTCKMAKDTFRIVLYVTTFYMHKRLTGSFALYLAVSETVICL